MKTEIFKRGKFISFVVIIFLLRQSLIFSQAVTSPGYLEIIRHGQNVNIQWTTEGLSCTVKIDLWRNSSIVQTLTSSTTNDGSYTWTVSSSLATGSGYRISVHFNLTGYGNGYSEYFYVEPPQFSITGASWSNLTDVNGDGYTRSRILNITINNTSTSAIEALEIRVYPDGSSEATYGCISSLTVKAGSNVYPYTIGYGSSIGGELSHNTYDIKILLKTACVGTLLAGRSSSDDGDLGNEDFETSSQDVCSTPPQPGPISGNTSVCYGTAQTYSISPVTGATSYSWATPADWPPSGAQYGTSMSTTANGTNGYIWVFANNSACGTTSSGQKLYVTVNNPPTQPGTISGSTSVCSGTIQTYSIPSVGGATTYTWNLPPGWSGSSSTNSINVTVGTNSGDVSVSAGNDCGPGTARILPVTVISIPAQPGTITGNTTVCSGSAQIYSVSSVPGATTYTWTLPSGWSGTSSTSSISCTAGSTGGDVLVTASNSCGTSIQQVLSVSVSTIQAPQIGPITAPTCTLSTGSVILNNLPSSGTWTLTRTPGGTITTGTGISTTISGLATGTYTYTVKNSDNCTSVSSGNIVIPAQPATPTAPVVGTITAPTCTLATGSVVLSGLPATGTWTLTKSPGGTTSTGTGTSTTISSLVSGTYTYTVKNSDNCTSVSSGNIVIPAQPATPTAPVVGTITAPTCELATGSVVLSGLPATGTWTLTRSPGGTTSTGTGTSTTISGLGTGTYTYTVKNSDNCTSVSSGNIVISAQPATPTAPVVGTITAPTCALSTGSVVLSGLPATGTWTLTKLPGGTTLTGTGTSTTISGLSAGTYTYTVKNSDNCTSVSSGNIVIPAQPATPTAPVVGAITAPTCALATGSVVLSGLPGTGTWTLTKSPGGTTSTGTGTSTTISGLVSGTYTYIVKNSDNCTSVSSGNVVIPSQPVTPTAPVIGSITAPTCTLVTGSVVLSGLPGSGTWTLTKSPGGSTLTGSGSSTTISGLVEGTYTYTVKNSDNCTSVSSGNIIIPAQPVPPTAPIIGNITAPTCELATGTVLLSGLPGTGTWTLTKSPGGTTLTGTGTNATISGLAAGTYTYTVKNSDNCTSGSSSDIIINSQPATPSSPVIGNITHPTCTVPLGSVDLTGLPSTDQWTVTMYPNGSTTTGTGTSATITGIAAGTYAFTVSNSSGCASLSSSDAVLSTPAGAPSAPITGALTQPSCTLLTGSVELSNLPSAGTWTLTKSPGGETYTGSGTTKTITGLTPGTYAFSVINNLSCSSAPGSLFTISTQPSTPSSPAVGTITQPTCSTPTGSVVLSGLPPAGSWTITRSPGDIQATGSGTSISISALPAGTYTFTVTNSSGCVSGLSSNVVINNPSETPSAPVIGSVTHPTCLVSTGIVDLKGLPGSGTWTIKNNSNNLTIDGSGTTTILSLLSPGSLTFSVTNSAGCTSLPSETVVINSIPAQPSAPSFGNVVHPTCTVPTGSVVINGLPVSGNWTLTRSPGNAVVSGSGSSATVNSIPSGTYTFTVTTIPGCVSNASNSFTINEPPLVPSAPLTGAIVQPTCLIPTGTVTISGLPGSGTWTLTRSPGGSVTGSGGTFTASNLNPGSYFFSVKGSGGCESVNSQIVIIKEPDMGSIPKILSKWDGEVLFCNNSGDSLRSYQWFKDGVLLTGEDHQYIVVKNKPGDYSVQAVDINGCKNFSSLVNYRESKSLTTFPNPAAKTFSLDFSGDPGSSTVMTIVNSGGSKLMEVRGNGILDPAFKNIDISSFKEGTYIVRVLIDGSELYFTKLVIIK